MIENAMQVGAYFKQELERIGSDIVKTVRGRGLMLGVEFHQAAGGARRYCEALKAKGLLCKETHDHIIRFAPPLVITRDQVDWALDRIEAVIGGRQRKAS
jgi:ornithine--oxo-acid transaminase